VGHNIYITFKSLSDKGFKNTSKFNITCTKHCNYPELIYLNCAKLVGFKLSLSQFKDLISTVLLFLSGIRQEGMRWFRVRHFSITVACV